MTANIISHQNVTKLENVITPDAINAPVSTSPPFAVAHSAAIESFRKKVGNQTTDEHILRFLRGVSFVENHRGSYTFRDVVIHSNWFLEIGSVTLLRDLFDDYTSCLVQNGRLTVLENFVSDETVFIIQ